MASGGLSIPTSQGEHTQPLPYVSSAYLGATAVKNLEPLVVFGGLSYVYAMRTSGARLYGAPPDSVVTRLGASLAISPFTAVTAGLNASYVVSANPYYQVQAQV